MGTGGLLPWGKEWPELETDHLPPYSAVVKNDGAILPHTPICLYGTFYILILDRYKELPLSTDCRGWLFLTSVCGYRLFHPTMEADSVSETLWSVRNPVRRRESGVH